MLRDMPEWVWHIFRVTDVNSVIRRSFVRIESRCKPSRVSRVTPGRIAQCKFRVETGSLVGYHWAHLVVPASPRLWMSGFDCSWTAFAAQSSPISASAADWADPVWQLILSRSAALRGKRPLRVNRRRNLAQQALGPRKPFGQHELANEPTQPATQG